MLRPLGIVLVLTGLALIAIGSTHANSAQGRTDEVIALERGALDRWAKGDVGGFLEIYDDEITYFDPVTDRRVDGIEAMHKWYAPFAGKFAIDRYELVNPKVQRYGDVAVLTYVVQNYNRDSAGNERPATRWNVSEVFQRSDGKWRTVHSHFSYTRPELKTP
jgi:uncharacterized protein (TIGR02246 family)